MTRRMADSVTPGNLPAGFDLYGGYDDGRYLDAPAIRAEYPGKIVVAFTVFASDDEGDCLDVENGDATPAQAPAWVARRRQDGHAGPLVYCSWSALDSVIAAFRAANVPLPGFIVAGYPSPDGDAIPVVEGVNIVAHQWIDRGPYDESIVVDYLPGIDPSPTPAPPSASEPRGPYMLHTIDIPTDANGNGYVKTAIPWSTFMAVSGEGSDPEVTADDRYFGATPHVQDRGGNVLVSVTGYLARSVASVFILATD